MITRVFTLIAALTFVGSLHAQMDPSTALLLRTPSGAGSAVPREGGDLDPEIYHVRSRPTPARRPAPAPMVETSNLAKPAPTPLAQAAAPVVRAPAAAGVAEDALAVRVSGGYLFLDAQSRADGRDYALAAPTVGLGLDLWLSPAFGLRGGYVSSLAAGTRDGASGRRVGADVQRLDLGLAYRRQFDLYGEDTDVDLALSYRESSVTLARSAAHLLGQENHGLDLTLAATRPASTVYAHQFEVHVTSLVRNRLTPGAGLALGGRYDFDAGTRVFWRAEYTWEQNAFAHATANKYLTLFTLGAEWGS